MSTPAVTGKATTIADDVWEGAAKSLGPDKSLERIETHAKYLFSTVTIFGTLLTGFGLVTTNKTIVEDPSVLKAPIILVCISLALSMYAMTPSGGRVNINNLVQVRSYLGKRVLQRGIAIFVAGLVFAAAILTIIPLFTRAASHRVTTALVLKATRGEKNDDLSASVKVQNLSADAVVEVKGDVKRGDAYAPVYWQRAARPGGGELAIDFTVPEAGNVSQFHVVVNATLHDKQIASDELTLQVEPRPAPTPAPPPAKKKPVKKS